jgi:hypothetical protein
MVNSHPSPSRVGLKETLGAKAFIAEPPSKKIKYKSALSCESVKMKVSQFFKNAMRDKSGLIIATQKKKFPFYTLKYYQSFKSYLRVLE